MKKLIEALTVRSGDSSPDEERLRQEERDLAGLHFESECELMF